MWFRSLAIAAAALALAACGGQIGGGIADGDYAGVNAAGQEVLVSLSGSNVTVDGTRADLDQTAQDLTFDVDDSTHAHWVCVPIDQGISCRVTEHGARQRIELTQT